VVIKFLKEDGTSIVQTRTLAATSQTTIRVDEVEGLEAASFSTIVTSTEALPIVVDGRCDGMRRGMARTRRRRRRAPRPR
jgi:hypothetical protein